MTTSTFHFVIRKMKELNAKKVDKDGRSSSKTYSLEAIDEDTGNKLTLKSELPLDDFDLKTEIQVKAVTPQKKLK